MTRDRQLAIENDQTLALTDEEIKEGWHWCLEFDGLLVGPGMGEMAGCHEHCGLHISANTLAAIEAARVANHVESLGSDPFDL